MIKSDIDLEIVDVPKKKTRLENLIHDIKSGKITFNRTNKLVTALDNLNSIIGHKKLKDQIVDQIYYISGCKKSNNPLDFPMLNTVLYGPPGVGKTTLCHAIARIWMAMNVLPKYSVSESEEEELKKEKETSNINVEGNYVYYGNNNSYSFLMFLIFILFIGFIIFMFLFKIFGVIFAILIIIFLVFFITYIFTFFTNNNKKVENKVEIKNKENKENEDYEDYNKIVEVVRRDDLIGKYVGHTADKTKKVLMNSLGKVLFIDEAYSLINSDRDDFGNECLNVINQFMSENKGKFICIFAGYKDKLMNGPFLYQPGLIRRFMWHIDCEGYDYEEMYSIFKYQTNKDKLDILPSDEDKILELFRLNIRKFPCYGGDTEKMLFYAKLDYYKDNINEKHSTGYLTYNNIFNALERLNDNNPEPVCQTDIQKLLQNFNL